MADVPSMVLDNIEKEISPNPATDPNIAKFAPPKYRTPSTLAQTTSDMKRIINDMQREHDEYTRKIKQQWDELLRIIG